MSLKLKDKFLPSEGRLIISATELYEGVGTGEENVEAVQETTIIPETDHIKFFYSATQALEISRVCLATTPDMINFTKLGPVVGHGYGGAPNGRSASASCVFKYGGFYYMFALNGYGFEGTEDRCVYRYKSTTGMPGTWQDLGKVFDNGTYAGVGTVYGWGNTSVWPELIDGKFYATCDIWDGSIWVGIGLSADSIEGEWTPLRTFPSLYPAPGCSYGGMQIIYKDGTWHSFWHGVQDLSNPTSPGNLYSLLGYSTSTDFITWVTHEFPFKGINQNNLGLTSPPFPNTDQIADPWVSEWNGKTYMAAEYTTNVDGYKSQIRLWEFDGTLDKLVTLWNIYANRPAIVVAKQAASFAVAGLTASNILKITKVGNPNKSYIPGSSLNTIDGFEVGPFGYYIEAKANLDLSNHVLPPI